MKDGTPRGLNLVGTENGDGSAAAAKILGHQQLIARRAQARAAGQRIVQCHGCFDIVHPGHLRHLRHARSHGDLLLVTLTGDAQMSKGTGRPLIPEELRAENLAALDCVDWVYVEQRPTAVELLDEVQPDVYVKGREYELNDDPRFKAEREAVLRHGGRVVFSSGDVVFSSTALIAALEQSVDPYHARLTSLLEREELDGVELARTIGRFRGKKVLVVGETISDTYVLCDRPEVAGESPIMTLRPVEQRHYDGGAAIVARHLAAMGARPILVTGLPDDDKAAQLRRRMAADGVEVRSITTETALPEKQRFLVGGQKVMKLDLLQRIELDAARQDQLIGLAVETARGGWTADQDGSGAGGCDAAIVTDYGLGLFTLGMLMKLCPELRKYAGVMSGDVSGRRSNLRGMRGMDLLCPSESELRDAYRLFDQGLSMVAWRLLADTRTRAALVTMGPEGLIAFDRVVQTPLGAAAPETTARTAADWTTHVKGEHVPSLASHAIDPLGCGDSLISAATLALASGASLVAAGFLGSIGAAVQVQRLGNTVVSATDLRHGVARLHTAHLAYVPAEVMDSRRSGGGVRVASPELRTAGVGA